MSAQLTQIGRCNLKPGVKYVRVTKHFERTFTITPPVIDQVTGDVTTAGSSEQWAVHLVRGARWLFRVELLDGPTRRVVRNGGAGFDADWLHDDPVQFHWETDFPEVENVLKYPEFRAYEDQHAPSLDYWPDFIGGPDPSTIAGARWDDVFVVAGSLSKIPTIQEQTSIPGGVAAVADLFRYDPDFSPLTCFQEEESGFFRFTANVVAGGEAYFCPEVNVRVTIDLIAIENL